MTDDRPARSELKAATLRGARWVTLGRIVAESVALLSTVALARLLTPAEFGHAAVANFVYALALAIPSIGVGSQVVRAEEASPALLRTAMLLALASGAALTVATWALVPLLALPFGRETAELIALAAPAFAILSAGAVPQAMLQRRLDFRRLALNDIVALLPGVAVSLTCAALDVGAASLILGVLTTALLTTLLSFAAVRPPRPAWDRAQARAVTAFGAPATASSLLFVAFRNIDYAILGARLDPARVGLYWRAYQLGVEYQGKISGILLRIALPVFSRATSPEDLRAIRGRIVKLHAVLIFPLLALLAALAPVLVPWMYGAQWDGAVRPTQILAAAGAANAINTGIGPLMLALGRATELMTASAVLLVVYAAAVLASAPHGLTAVCVAVAGTQVVSMFGQQYFLVERLAGIRLVATLRDDVLPAATASAALIAVAWPLGRLGDGAGVPALLTLALATPAGLAAYGAVLRLLFRDAWDDGRMVAGRILPRIGRRRGAPAPEPEPAVPAPERVRQP